MGIIELIVVIAVVGVIVWAITYVAPMPAAFQRAIYAIAVVFLVLYVLNWLGWLGGFHALRLGR